MIETIDFVSRVHVSASLNESSIKQRRKRSAMVDQQLKQQEQQEVALDEPVITEALDDNFIEVVDMEEIEEMLRHMRVKESTIYARDEVENELAGLWRRMLVEWMYYVVDFCHLHRQSVAAGAFFLDVAMSRGLCITREDHQLAAATSLQLALKTFDTSVIKLEKLVKLGRDLFTSEDVTRMEMKIIQSLNWQVHPVSVYCFLWQYERLLPEEISPTTKEMISDATQLIAELSVSNEQYNTCPPSILAYATMLLALGMIGSEDILPIHLRECFVVRMSAVAHIDCHSSDVLEAFDCLRETLDHSNKRQALLESLATKTKEFIDKNTAVVLERTSQDKNSSRTGNVRSDTSTQGIMVGMQHSHSPRDVKVRIGSGSLSSLSNHSTGSSLGSVSS
jgi:hypothetical protein